MNAIHHIATALVVRFEGGHYRFHMVPRPELIQQGRDSPKQLSADIHAVVKLLPELYCVIPSLPHHLFRIVPVSGQILRSEEHFLYANIASIGAAARTPPYTNLPAS